MVQPSSMREGFSSIPNITWDDVGGLTSLKKKFEDFIIKRIKHPEVYEVNIFSHFCSNFCLAYFIEENYSFLQLLLLYYDFSIHDFLIYFQEFGVNLEDGILLYGPPGCGKTLVAKAVANAAGANFIHIQVPSVMLLSKCPLL